METRRVIAPPWTQTQRRTAPGEHAGACHRRWTWILPEIAALIGGMFRWSIQVRGVFGSTPANASADS
jgi:hypothetical protein